jgi:hypothetical protein
VQQCWPIVRPKTWEMVWERCKRELLYIKRKAKRELL